MNQACAISGPDAKRDSATDCTAPAWISAVMRAAHRLWRHRTRAELLAKTKASPRSVSYWMGRERMQMSADHLVALMRADPANFVPAVLGNDAYRALAREVIRVSQIEELRRRQDEQRRLLDRLEREAGE